jgi:SHAQKYF class myb-like DNA-binding protein
MATKKGTVPIIVDTKEPAYLHQQCDGISKMTDNSNPHSQQTDGNIGRWTKEEHQKFIEAIELFGRDWKKVQAFIGTRTTTQAASHAQKYFSKVDRSAYALQCGNRIRITRSRNNKRSIPEGNPEQGHKLLGMLDGFNDMAAIKPCGNGKKLKRLSMKIWQRNNSRHPFKLLEEKKNKAKGAKVPDHAKGKSLPLQENPHNIYIKSNSNAIENSYEEEYSKVPRAPPDIVSKFSLNFVAIAHYDSRSENLIPADLLDFSVEDVKPIKLESNYVSSRIEQLSKEEDKRKSATLNCAVQTNEFADDLNNNKQDREEI